MDLNFLSQRLLTIAKHNYSNILLKKEKLYYQRYMLKLSYELEFLNIPTVENALAKVNSFESIESKRIENGFIVKPKRIIKMVCDDARDVLNGMKRYDGVGLENEKWFLDNWKVNFGRLNKSV